MNDALEAMLKKYELRSETDFKNSLKEIMQEIALLGLWRGKFFEKAAFYGGTALRILYGLNRFSEDLDFSLLKEDAGFKLKSYHSFVQQELESYGFKVSLETLEKEKETGIESAFIKAGTKSELIHVSAPPHLISRAHRDSVLKIKLEVDVKPPPAFETESKLILLPTQFYVNTFTPPSLFAGKVHALLYRTWKSRVKGRDWFDFVWYVSRNIPLHLAHLEQRIAQSEHTSAPAPLSESEVRRLLKSKIETVDFQAAKKDVAPFIKNPRELDIWSKEFFLDVTDRMTFV